jgi:hypothetical protein
MPTRPPKQASNYTAIKTRALEMLRAGRINHSSWDDLKALTRQRHRDFALANNIGVALCRAREEIEIGSGKFGFNTGNFHLAVREIHRLIAAEARLDRRVKQRVTQPVTTQ